MDSDISPRRFKISFECDSTHESHDYDRLCSIPKLADLLAECGKRWPLDDVTLVEIRCATREMRMRELACDFHFTVAGIPHKPQHEFIVPLRIPVECTACERCVRTLLECAQKEIESACSSAPVLLSAAS